MFLFMVSLRIFPTFFGLRETLNSDDLVLTYAKKLSEFEDMIRRMIFEKLGLKNYLNEHKKSGDYLLGLLKYRPPKDGEKNVGLTPHTDKTISTILSQYDKHVNGLQVQQQIQYPFFFPCTVNGLQIMDKNGQWIDVQYSSPHSYLFLVSDCLKVFTNGKLHCPTHQVIVGNQERYSISFINIPKEGHIIKVPEELVDEDHPLLYKPFDGSKFLPFTIAEARRGNVVTLESYCGITANTPNLI
ncbi:hypothetical protein P3S68_024805 [Capsicum galapagoense]